MEQRHRVLVEELDTAAACRDMFPKTPSDDGGGSDEDGNAGGSDEDGNAGGSDGDGNAGGSDEDGSWRCVYCNHMHWL